jgi:beta-lactamase superfamily II metal-dependent hydrolase
MRKLAVASIIAILVALFAGCAGGEEAEFDETPPMISGVSVSNITQTSATVAWVTDESSTSEVTYRRTDIHPAVFYPPVSDENLVTSHSIRLSGLTAGTTYHYWVESKDASGNEATSEDDTFTTLPPLDTTAPVISDVTVADITETTARITWTTDEPATSRVEYGKTIDYWLRTCSDGTLVIDHSVSLSGLEPDTIYHFRVKSEDEAGNEAASGDNSFTTAQPTLDTLTVCFIDVGQGDSILIDFGDIEVLIDGGDRSPGVVEYLNEYVNGALEVIVATHPHVDHIGGLIEVLNTFEVQEVWHNGDTSTSQTYSEFMDAVQAEGAEVHVAHRGDEIEAGGLTFTVLNPATLAGTTNNNSIVLSLSYGEVDFLFTGDAEQEAEASMVGAGIVPDVEILKVGHHGSRTASSASFLAAAQPETAIYMAGVGNSYGHPHAETISALQAIGASIYGTNVHGTIVVTTDGTTYNVEPTNQVPPVTP